MRLAVVIARYLMGVLFTVFGLNGFLHFIPQPPPSSPMALQYLTVLSASHYLYLVFLIQLVAGILLLLNRYVPLALVLLAPILVNILLFHSLMDPGGLPPGVLASICWLIVFLYHRRSFDGILSPAPHFQTTSKENHPLHA